MNHITKMQQLNKKIKLWTIFFIISLVLSGITAFPLETELTILSNLSHHLFNESNELNHWVQNVYEGIQQTNHTYPFLAYGTDWLAFAHIVIAIFFIGVLKDPIKNTWILQAGVIACILIIPLAFIAGEIRGIPVYWRLIDCSFGIIGIIPLLFVMNLVKKLEQLKKDTIKNYIYKGL